MQDKKQTDDLAKHRLTLWIALINLGAAIVKLLSGVITYGRPILDLRIQVSEKREMVLRAN